MNNDGLLAAGATIRSHPDLAHTLNLLVASRGEIVFERCYRGSVPADSDPGSMWHGCGTKRIPAVWPGAENRP